MSSQQPIPIESARSHTNTLEIDLSKLKAPFELADIEWRVARSGISPSTKKPWAMVLAYVDARAVQDRLDQVCGPSNWKDEYTHVEGGVVCRLSIRVNGEWITKENGSPETKVEAFKGGLSKALVRAASTWGIGRYLYKIEENFAIFVDDKSSNRVTIDGQTFYWVPPALPQWALPSQSTAKNNQKKTSENKTASPSIQQPANTEYIAPFGPYRGKTFEQALKEFGIQHLQIHFEQTSKTQNSVPQNKKNPAIVPYLSALEEFLMNAGAIRPEPDCSEVPF
jgi:hypothetical protein